MVKMILFILALVLLLNFGLVFADSGGRAATELISNNSVISTPTTSANTNNVSPGSVQSSESENQILISSAVSQIAQTSVATQVATQTAIVSCTVDESLQKQMNELMTQLNELNNNNTEFRTQIKLKISTISEEMTKQKEQCTIKIQPSEAVIVPTPISSPESVTTNQICSIPYELENKLKGAWSEYEILVKGDGNGTIDMIAMKQVKENISNAETEINKIKQDCQPTTTSTPVWGGKNWSGSEQVPNTPNQDNPSQNAPGQAIAPGENCTVPVELTQEFEGLWNNYNKAISNNDTAQADEIKIKISTIEQKLSSTKGQCVKTIVSDNVGTRDVAGYYKQKVTEVMVPGMDPDSQITQLKILRNEIDNMIMELLNKKNKLNASDVSGVVDEIKMKHNSIQAGNSTISTTTATISTQINNQNIEVQPSETGVTMTDGTTVVSIPELSIRANKISIADQVIQVAPSAVMAKAKMQNTKQLNISVENGTPVYDIKGDENRKLLGIIPVTMEKQVKVDATNGDVLSEQKPWWSGLTSESN